MKKTKIVIIILLSIIICALILFNFVIISFLKELTLIEKNSSKTIVEKMIQEVNNTDEILISIGVEEALAKNIENKVLNKTSLEKALGGEKEYKEHIKKVSETKQQSSKLVNTITKMNVLDLIKTYAFQNLEI